MTEEIEEYDHKYTSEIVCPYCGHETSDSWEYADDDYMQCCECDKHFYVSKDVEVTYSTSKTCTKNGIDHDWNEIQHHEYKGKNLSYRTCKICRQHDSLTKRDDNA